MFIKITKNSLGVGYYHLVETYREKRKVKQRTLLSLGKVGEDRIDALASAIAKHKEIFTTLELAKHISIEDTYILGPLLVVDRLFETSGMNKIFGKILAKHPKLSFDLRKIVFTMVVSRFIKAGSKLKIYEHWQKRVYPEMIKEEIPLHHLYRSLDILADEKDEIERDLYWNKRDLLNLEVDVVLYDLTTLRFESTREDLGDLRRFGYSKERRTDCTQVVLGLLVDTEGMPLGFEVYPGNTFEGTTVTDIVQKMRNKFKVRRFIFVGDRGLFSKKNLEILRGVEAEKKGEFIVGIKLGVFKNRHEEFYDISRYNFINDELAIYETEHDGDRCVITWTKVRAERDKKSREDILEKIRKKLLKKKLTAKDFVTNKTYQRYVLGLNDGKNFTLNENAILEDAKKDGYFGVVSNVKDMSANELVKNYKSLWEVEDAFGEIKGTLKSRPTFHWKDKRIVGHLCMCFLSYLCEAIVTKSLRDKKIFLKSRAIDEGIIDPRPLTVAEAMKELIEVKAIPVNIRSTTIWTRTDINGNAAKLFQAIGLVIPPKILSVKKEICSGTN